MKADILPKQGHDGMTEYEWRNEKVGKRAATESPAERKLSEHLKDHFRIYFPSRETVAKSKGGIGVSVSALRTPPPLVPSDA